MKLTHYPFLRSRENPTLRSLDEADAPKRTFSECFAEMRIWLDAHKIIPVNFRLSGGYASIGLDVAFTNSEEADLLNESLLKSSADHRFPGGLY